MHIIIINIMLLLTLFTFEQSVYASRASRRAGSTAVVIQDKIPPFCRSLLFFSVPIVCLLFSRYHLKKAWCTARLLETTSRMPASRVQARGSPCVGLSLWSPRAKARGSASTYFMKSAAFAARSSSVRAGSTISSSTWAGHNKISGPKKCKTTQRTAQHSKKHSNTLLLYLGPIHSHGSRSETARGH